MNELINQYGFNVNILFSSMSDIQDETICYLWLRFEHDAQFSRDTVESYFNERHIHYEEAALNVWFKHRVISINASIV